MRFFFGDCHFQAKGSRRLFLWDFPPWQKLELHAAACLWDESYNWLVFSTVSVCCLFCQQDYKKIKKILYWTDFLQTHINFWCRPRWRDGSRIVFFNAAVWTVFFLGGGTWSKQNRDLILRPPKHAVKHSNIYSSDNDPKIKEQAQNRLTACQNICIFIQIYVRFDTFWGFFV